MSIEIDGNQYVRASDLAEELGVARQTLWRWRSDGKIPAGYRYRDKQVVFTPEEADEVRKFAHRLEPADTHQPRQLNLFSTKETRR